MRILSTKEKQLVHTMYQNSQDAQKYLDAYQVLDSKLVSDATKRNDEQLKITSNIWRLAQGNNGVTLYALLRLLETNGYIRTLNRYEHLDLDFLLQHIQQMDNIQYLKGTMNWEIFIYLYNIKIEFLEPFRELARADGKTLEEELLNDSKKSLSNSEKLIAEAGGQTRLAKCALWITVIFSLISTVLSIISLCK